MFSLFLKNFSKFFFDVAQLYSSCEYSGYFFFKLLLFFFQVFSLTRLLLEVSFLSRQVLPWFSVPRATFCFFVECPFALMSFFHENFSLQFVAMRCTEKIDTIGKYDPWCMRENATLQVISASEFDPVLVTSLPISQVSS